MGKFEGMKLLELGTNVGSVDIVKYAKSEGAFVVVADYLPPEKSDAKQIADEAIEISTLDTDALIDYAKKNKINAAISGVSEANIESARQINEAINNKYFYNSKQWKNFMTKSLFRELCQKYSVPTPKTYHKGSIDFINKESIEYPVIVKPVDNGANAGISVCYQKDDLDKAIEFALSFSDKKEIIIEQFIYGTEVSSTYVIQNGNCQLVCIGDKYAYENENKLRALSNAYIYPSLFYKEYLNKVDKYVKDMILGESIDNCTIFFQGIYDKGEFYIFEAGLRMEGTASFRITNAMNNQNFMHFLVDGILKTKTDYDIKKEDAFFTGRKCVVFSQILDGGEISKIEGISAIENDPMIISFEQRHKIGDFVKRDGTLRQIMFRYVMIDSDMNKVIEKIKYIQDTVRVYDPSGKNILLNCFNPDILRRG